MPRRRSLMNDLKHAFQGRQSVFVAKAKHQIFLRCEPRIATFVVHLARFEIMTFAINLDNETRRMTSKIRNKSSHRNLTTKAQSSEAMGFEISPKQRLGARHCAPKMLREPAPTSVYGCMRHGPTPLPNPPPQGGREHVLPALCAFRGEFH